MYIINYKLLFNFSLIVKTLSFCIRVRQDKLHFYLFIFNNKIPFTQKDKSNFLNYWYYSNKLVTILIYCRLEDVFTDGHTYRRLDILTFGRLDGQTDTN